jgi:hypothetical protein
VYAEQQGHAPYAGGMLKKLGMVLVKGGEYVMLGNALLSNAMLLNAMLLNGGVCRLKSVEERIVVTRVQSVDTNVKVRIAVKQRSLV